MAKFNYKKTVPIISVDWIENDNKSKPFYQVASGSSPERYSVTCISNYLTTGGQLLQERMNSCTGSGLQRILNYYSKTAQAPHTNSIYAEDFYVSERPGAKMKVLVSLPTNALENLPDKQISTDSPFTHEIRLSTFGLRNKISVVNNFIKKYGEEIEKFRGRVYGINFERESSKLSAFISALSTLMLENKLIYSDGSSHLVTLFTNDKYEVLYARIIGEQGPIIPSKGFDTFLEHKSVRNKRTIYFLKNLDRIEKTSLENRPLSWSKFFETFVYNPPNFDFTKPRPRSYNLKNTSLATINRDNDNPVKTEKQLQGFAGIVDAPDFRADIDKHMSSITDFIGDDIMGNLEALSDWAEDWERLFSEILNYTGLDGILKAALNCFNLPSEFGSLADLNSNLLKTGDQLMSQIQSLFLPTMTFDEQSPPIVDFMQDMLASIAQGVVQAAIEIIIAMVKSLIKMLLDFCTECSLRTEDGEIKKFNRFNYGAGGVGVVDRLGAAFSSAGISQAATAGVLKGITQTQYQGDFEVFAQNTLKDSISRIELLLKDEANKIWEKIQNGKPKFIKEWRATLGLRSNQNITEKRIYNWLKNQPDSPWKTNAFKEASKELSEWMNTCLTSFTPSEVGNALLGCGVPPEAREISRNALKNFPALCLAFCGETDEDTDANIADLYEAMGNLIGQDPILRTVAGLAENVPEQIKCLCELSDEDLRFYLLHTKDSDMTPEQVREQVRKAKDRRKKQLNDMSNLLGRRNLGQDWKPNWYCTASADGTIIPGLIPLDNPVKQHATKRTLDVIYDNVKMTFNSDVRGYIPAMGLPTVREEEVVRTIPSGVDISGVPDRIINPVFRDLVDQGLYSYGSLPAGSVVPNSKPNPLPNGKPTPTWGPHDIPFVGEVAGPEDEGNRIRYWPALAWAFDEWDNPMGAGIWEEGQKEPTAEQEDDWVEENIRRIGKSGRDYGVQLEDPSRLGKDKDDLDATMDQYVNRFGRSPIPIMKKVLGTEFIPGLKEAYQQMCVDKKPTFQMLPSGDGRASSIYKLIIYNNLIKRSGFDINQINTSLTNIKSGGALLEGIAGREARSTDLDDAFETLEQATVTAVTTLLATKFEIYYEVPGVGRDHYGGSHQPLEDRYQINLVVESNEAGSTRRKTLQGPLSVEPLRFSVQQAILKNDLNVVGSDWHTDVGFMSRIQPQAGYFYDFLTRTLNQGYPLYRDEPLEGDPIGEFTPIPVSHPNNPAIRTASGWWREIQPTNVLNPDGLRQFHTGLFQRNAYQALYKDLFCSVTNQISESPYMEYIGGMQNVNLVPPKYRDQPDACHRTLLDIDLIKQQIMKEHDLIKCIHKFFRDPKNLASNRDSAFEIANRGGCILLIVRLYALEFLLKSIAAYHYFAVASAEDVDSTSVYHIFNQISQEIRDIGIGTEYWNEFQHETIKLYNRNRPENQKLDAEAAVESSWPFAETILSTIPNPELRSRVKRMFNWPKSYLHFHTALKHIIRYQVYSISKRLPNFVNGVGDLSPHSILIEEWLPAIEPRGIQGAAQQNQFLKEDGGNPKPLKNLEEVGGVPSVTPEQFAARFYSLKTEIIDQTQAYIEDSRIGYILSIWFKPDRRLQKFASWNRAKLQSTWNRIWPVANTSDPCWKNRKTMVGFQRELSSLSPIENCRDDTPSELFCSSGEYRYRDDGSDIWRVGTSESEKIYGNKLLMYLRASQYWTGEFEFDRPYKNVIDPKSSSEWTPPSGDWNNWKRLHAGQMIAPVVKHPRSDGPFWTQYYARGLTQNLSHGSDAQRAAHTAARQQLYGKHGHNDRSMAKYLIDMEGLLYDIGGDCAEDAARPSAMRAADRNAISAKEKRTSGGQEYSVDVARTAQNRGLFTMPDYRFHGPGSILKALTTWKKSFLGVDFPGDRLAPGYGIGFKHSGNGNAYAIHPYFKGGDLNLPLRGRDGTPGATGADGKIPMAKHAIPVVELRSSNRVGEGGIHLAHRLNPLHRRGGSRESMHEGRLLNSISWNMYWADGSSESTGVGGVRSPQKTQYVSLLDLPLECAIQALKYEKFICSIFVDITADMSIESNRKGHSLSDYGLREEPSWQNHRIAVGATEEDYEFYSHLFSHYDEWIREFEEIYTNLKKAKVERDCLQGQLLDVIKNSKQPRNLTITPPMYDITNGNIFLEPYIRIVDYDETNPKDKEIIDKGTDVQGNIDYVKSARPKPNGSGRNPQEVVDVVNIGRWDQYMREAFTAPYPGGKLASTRISDPLDPEDCGDDLPSQKAQVTGLQGIVSEAQLGDYFKKMYYGLRICYLPGENELSYFQSQAGTDQLHARIKEKTYIVSDNVVLSGGQRRIKKLNPVPIVSVETSVDMKMLISEATRTHQIPNTDRVFERAETDCADGVAAGPEMVDVGHFKWLFSNLPATAHEGYKSPLKRLEKEITRTNEYAFLFKYCFPIDRMLSLVNMYNSTYLSSLPDMKSVFQPTKQSLKNVFVSSLRAGDWKNACEIGNSDQMEALLNGLEVPWASLITMAVKWPLNVYKAFVEQADMNVAMSKNIQKVIRAMNSTIATGVAQAEQLKIAVQNTYRQIEAGYSLEDMGESCGFGINANEWTKAPPPSWDIPDQLIPPLETYMLGLLMMPPLIFGPATAPFGIPLSPYGFVYWFLDDGSQGFTSWVEAQGGGGGFGVEGGSKGYLGGLNWFDFFPDWIEKQFAKAAQELPAETDQECPVDFGLPELNARYGEGNDTGNGGTSDGGSTY